MGMDTKLPVAVVPRRIFIIRGHRVMISADLAALYGVTPKVLLQAVRRNRERFPSDFMFQLGRRETRSLSGREAGAGRGNYAKFAPYAFTEQGVAMLSSVLRSPRAIQVNIAIMCSSGGTMGSSRRCSTRSGNS